MNAVANKRAFADDINLPLLLAMEKGAEDGRYEKADLFSLRTIRPNLPPTNADSAEDALMLSLNYRNRVDFPTSSGCMLMGSNRNSGAPYVITVEPSAPQYVPQQSATQNNTLLYVMLFVLGTALVAICAFMAASHLFNKSSTELERVRYMLSDLAGVDD